MYRVGVIGLGSIAEGYGKPEDRDSFCHVGGILYSDRVELAAVADLQQERLDNFRTKWGPHFPAARYYPGDEEMLAAEELDIVAVCVRGPDHFDVTSRVLDAGPRSVFLEKPPSMSLEQMDRMVAHAAARSIPITVSYSRHWSPHVLRLEELVKDGLIGEVRTVVGYVGGTFLSFASHVTDLICQFAGYCPKTVFAHGRPGTRTPSGQAPSAPTPAGGRAFTTRSTPVPDDFEPEPSVAGMLIEFGSGVTGIHVGANGQCGGFYVEVTGTEGQVRAGIYTPPYARDKDGREIDLSAHGMPENASVFTVAYAQIADHLDGGPLPACTNDDFIAVNEIGFAGIESMHTGHAIPLPNTHRTRRIFANG